MRAGCGGCLLLLIILGAGVAGAAWIVWAAAEPPDSLPSPGSAADGQRAQQKIFDLIQRGGAARGATSSRVEDVTLTEAEINGLLARHLGGVRGVPLSGMAVRLVGDGTAEIYGRTQLRQALADEPGRVLVDYLPQSTLDRTFWIRMGGRVRLETEASRGRPRSLRLDVERLYLGRQRVPVALARFVLPGDTTGLLRWSLPEAVVGVTVDPGVAVIRAVGSPPRSGAGGRR